MIFNDYEPTLCTIFRLPSSIYLMDIVLYRFAIAHYLITLYHEKDKEFMAETIKHVFILQLYLFCNAITMLNPNTANLPTRK